MSIPDTRALRGVVAIGASAGGVDALQRLARRLPADLPMAVCVVLHIPATSRSVLAEIIARDCALPVAAAQSGDLLRPGHIYVAPPDRHLLVRFGRLELERGPKENGVRPAVDPLLRSAASVYGTRAVGVILSGALSDGASGAAAVHFAGGLVIVQDPVDALVPSMPRAALTAAPGARALPLDAIGEALAEHARTLPAPEKLTIMGGGNGEESTLERSRTTPDWPPTGLTCPECHGPLWLLEPGPPVRYRCRVGHLYHEDHLLDSKDGEVEAALWAAVEALEERADLLERVGERLRRGGNGDLAAGFTDRRGEAMRRAEFIRSSLLATPDAQEPAA